MTSYNVQYNFIPVTVVHEFYLCHHTIFIQNFRYITSRLITFPYGLLSFPKRCSSLHNHPNLSITTINFPHYFKFILI